MNDLVPLEQELHRAVGEHDRAALERLLADDFLYITGRGTVHRAEWIEMAMSIE